MERLLAPPLPPGCPWGGFTPPNVDWCEENLCAWVVNPAGTWSNLAYVVLGIAMWRLARRPAAASSRGLGSLRTFGPAGVAVGIFSGVYHASYTYALQILDFVGMFVFIFTLMTANARRLGWVRNGAFFYFGGIALFTALVPVLFEIGVPIQGLVALLIVAALGQEIAIRQRSGPGHADYTAYFIGLALLGGAALFSALDVTRTWCDPAHRWLQGHALWHVLSALSLFAFFRFYQGLRGGPCSLSTP